VASRRDIEPLCERIYDATIEPGSWSDVLDDLARASDCAWAALLTRRSDAWIGWRISPAAAPEVDAYLRSDAPQRSITTERLFAIGHPGFISDHEHFTQQERHQDGFFQWAEAHGYRHGAATGFQLKTGDLAVVQVMRRAGQRRFGAADLHSLDRVRPHLARAAMLAARWKMERLRAAADALALVGIPAVVLSGDCKVMTANTLASQLTEHVAWLPQDRLALTDERASAKLRLQVRACAKFGSAYSASSFPAWDGAHHSAMIVHVIPLKGERRELFDGGLALAVFAPAGSPAVPDCDLIRELFDLTAAEARVAAQLAAGRSVEEIAGAHRVSTSTVRSQTKAILYKVGAHRQAELAARLGTLTSVRGPSERKR
jgi:DNA-binding CsgD family transcriptional regulator